MRKAILFLNVSILMFAARPALAQANDPPWLSCYTSLKTPEDPTLVGPDFEKLVLEYRRSGNIQGHTNANYSRIRAWANYADQVEQCANLSKANAISPFAYDATILTNQYEQSQTTSPEIWKSMLTAGDLAALASQRFRPDVGLVASGVMTLAHHGYELSGHEKDYERLKGELERQLALRLREDGRAASIVLSEYVKAVDSNEWREAFGVVSPEARQAVTLALAKLIQDNQDPTRPAQLEELRTKAKALTAPQAAQQKKLIAQGIKDKIKQTKANLPSEVSGMAADLAFLNENLVKEVLNKSLSDIERDRLGRLQPHQRFDLLNAYGNLSEADQANVRAGKNAAFLSLAGLSSKQINELSKRASIQVTASDTAAKWRGYRDNAVALSNIAGQFNIGGPDFAPSLALGATVFDQGAKMMSLAADTGSLGIGGALSLLSSGATIIGALQTFSGRRSSNGEQAQLAALSRQIAEVYAKLSEQIKLSQNANAQGFARLDAKIDVLLQNADWQNFGEGISKCNLPSNLITASSESRKAIFAALKKDDNAKIHVDKCEDFLIRPVGATYVGLPILRLDSAQLANLANTAGVLKDTKSVKDFRFDQAQYFDDTLYRDAYLYLLDEFDEEFRANKTQDNKRRPSLFELTTTPAVSVDTLDAKLATVLPFSPSKVIPDLENVIESEIDADWNGPATIREALDNPISVARANAMNLGLDRIAAVIPYVDLNGRPMDETTKATSFKKEHDARQEQLNKLYKYYAPIAIHASAQETMMSGDFLLPFLAKTLDDLDCADLGGFPVSEVGQNAGDDTRINFDSLKRNDKRSARTLAACRILHFNPTIRQNLLLWNLTSRQSPWAKPGRQLHDRDMDKRRFAYDLALNSNDRVLLDRIIEPSRLLPIKTTVETKDGEQLKTIYHYRIAGDCLGVDSAQLLEDSYRPDKTSANRQPSTRPSGKNLLPSNINWEQNRLKQCVSAPLPNAATLIEGRFQMSETTQLAHWLREKITRQAIFRNMGARAKSHERPILQLLAKD